MPRHTPDHGIRTSHSKTLDPGVFRTFSTSLWPIKSLPDILIGHPRILELLTVPRRTGSRPPPEASSMSLRAPLSFVLSRDQEFPWVSLYDPLVNPHACMSSRPPRNLPSFEA